MRLTWGRIDGDRWRLCRGAEVVDVPDGVMVLSATGRFLHLNRSAAVALSGLLGGGERGAVDALRDGFGVSQAVALPDVLDLLRCLREHCAIERAVWR